MTQPGTQNNDGSFIDAIRNRRSIYNLSADIPYSDQEIVDLVGDILKHVPSAWNAQTQRIALLFGEEHLLFWDIVGETLRERMGDEAYKQKTEPKMKRFKAGHGTLMFFDDAEETKALQEKFPNFAEHFGDWAHHANGMLQYAIWTSLEVKGLGANIQHYNPIIDSKVAAIFDLPESWTLIAQMVFGTQTLPPGEKTFVDLDKRMRVFGAEEPAE